MGRVAKLFKLEQFLFHRGCSFNLKSILETVLIARGKESREGRQTLFFTPWIPKNKSKVTGRVYTKRLWKRAQDAVCWIHLAKAQEQGTTFWQ